jgi:hypothetical protein
MKTLNHLYTCGCSWTEGAELEDYSKSNAFSIMYYNSWPWFLSQNLEIPILINEGSGAGSNARIFRKTSEFIFNYIEQEKPPEELLVIIGWTTPERNEIGIEDRIIKLTIQNPLIGHSKLQPYNEDIKVYHNKFYQIYSDHYGQRMQLLYMKNLRYLCKGLGIQYFDFIALGQYPDDQHLENLYPDTFQYIVASENLPVHQFGHPTKETHKIWADRLKEFIK